MLQRLGPVLAALIFAAGALGSTAIASRAAVRAVRIKQRDQTISVTGSARRRIRSDLVVWRAHVAARAPTLAAAYATLVQDVPRVREYLVGHGVAAGEIVTSSVQITELHGRTEHGEEIPEQIIAYSLHQVVQVTSHDIERVTRASRDVTELINQGIVLESDAPQYLYTRLAELKIQLIADAARDARVRAEQIAAQSRARLTTLSGGHMGVIQVNAANETETSAEGVNDTSSIEKDALAVVSVVFYTE